MKNNDVEPWMNVHHVPKAQVHKLPQNHCGDNREGTLFSFITPICFCKFEHSVCRGSLMTTYDHLLSLTLINNVIIQKAFTNLYKLS